MIQRLDENNKNYFNTSNEPFEVFGRLIPKFDGRVWTYEEELFSEPYIKTYPPDESTAEEYINSSEMETFLFFDGDICAGQICVRENWNKFTFIEDISVKEKYRRKGIGTALLNRASLWSAEHNLNGLMLETQDINLAACRFYQKYGMRLGAADNMLYYNFSTHSETALFWYK